MKTSTQQYLESLYLEFVNEYLTIDKMAEHVGMKLTPYKVFEGEVK